MMFLMKFQITARVLFNAALSFVKCKTSSPPHHLNSAYVIFQTCAKPSVPSKFASAAEFFNTSVLCQGNNENIFQLFRFDQPLNQHPLSNNFPIQLS